MAPIWEYRVRFALEPIVSVIADTAAFQECDRASMFYRLRLTVRAKALHENGMPSARDFDDFTRIEDKLEAGLKWPDARYVGRADFRGFAHLYVYAKTPEICRKTVTDAAEQIVAGRWEAGIANEPKWQTYLNLHPHADDWRMQLDAEVLKGLREHGDELIAPRRVDHWMYFDSSEVCDQMAERLRGHEFTVEPLPRSARDYAPWPLRAWRIDSVQPEKITPLTTTLLHLALMNCGTYDGWQTHALKTK